MTTNTPCKVYKNPKGSECQNTPCVGTNNYCGSPSPCKDIQDASKFLKCPDRYTTSAVNFVDTKSGKPQCLFTCEPTVFCTTNSKTVSFLKLQPSAGQLHIKVLLETNSSFYIFVGYDQATKTFVLDTKIIPGACDSTKTGAATIERKDVSVVPLEDIWDNSLLGKLWPKLQTIFPCMTYDDFLADNLPKFLMNLRTPQKCPDYKGLFYCDSANDCVKSPRFFDLKTVILFSLMLFILILFIATAAGSFAGEPGWKTALKILGFLFLTAVLMVIIVYVAYYIENTVKPQCDPKKKVDFSKVYKVQFVIPPEAKKVFKKLEGITSLDGVLYFPEEGKLDKDRTGKFDITFYTVRSDRSYKDINFFADNQFEMDEENCAVKFNFQTQNTGNCKRSIKTYLDMYKITLENEVYILEDGTLELSASLLNMFPLRVKAVPTNLSTVEAYAQANCFDSSSSSCKKIQYMKELISRLYKDDKCTVPMSS